MLPVVYKGVDFKLYGKIEKIFATFGFVVTQDGQRYFFHFGTCITKPEFFRVGDEVLFALGADSKTSRLHAQKLWKNPTARSQTCSSSAFTSIRTYVPPVTTPSSEKFSLLNNAGSYRLPQASIPTLPNRSKQSIPSAIYTAKPSSSAVGQSPLSFGSMTLAQLQQHSSVAVQCAGLVLNVPKSDVKESSGIIACELAGLAMFLNFSFSNLKHQQEKELLEYGSKIIFTAVWESSLANWCAKNILPLVQMQRGVLHLTFPFDHVTIDCLTAERRLTLPFENVILAEGQSISALIDRNKSDGGVFVEFASFLNEKGQEMITRLMAIFCSSSLSSGDENMSTDTSSSSDIPAEDYGSFALSGNQISSVNLSGKNPYDKAREAWFSVAG